MGLRRLREERFDLVILDLRLGEEDGLGVLSAIRKQHPGQAVVMVTAEGTIAEAVEATRRGAIDFVEKPVQLERLGHVMGLVQKTRHLETRLAELETEVKAHVMEPQFASQDASVQGVLEVLFRAADSPASRDPTDPSTSRRRGGRRRSMPRSSSRRSSAWATDRDDPVVAIADRARAPTCRCQCASRSRRRYPGRRRTCTCDIRYTIRRRTPWR